MLRSEKAENLIGSFCIGGLADSEMENYKSVSKIALVKLKSSLSVDSCGVFFLAPSIQRYFSSGMCRATIL